MNNNAPNEITQMLIELTGGNKEVVNQILPHIYDELQRLAGSYLRRERSIIHCSRPLWYTKLI